MILPGWISRASRVPPRAALAVAQLAFVPGRDQHHHIVIDLDLDGLVPPSEPDRDRHPFLVTAALEDPDIAEFVERRLDAHPYQSVRFLRARDLGMRDLDEIRALHHACEFVDEIEVDAVGLFALDREGRGVRIEMEIRLPQLFELVVIFVMKHRSQHAGKKAQSGHLVFGQPALADQAGEKVDLAQRDDALARRRGLA